MVKNMNTIKKISFTRVEKLSKKIRDNYKLKDKGLVIEETFLDNTINYYKVKEGGIRQYLLTKGPFK